MQLIYQKKKKNRFMPEVGLDRDRVWAGLGRTCLYRNQLLDWSKQRILYQKRL